jgi:hypothetical protein
MLYVNNNIEHFPTATTILISVGAGLISPIITLLHWIEEKSINRRFYDEMRRCGELLDFIHRCPELISTAGSADSALLDKATTELAQSLIMISHLLEVKSKKKAPPPEIAWPRRLLLLYSPRTWTAAGLHFLCHIATIFLLLILVSVGYDEQTDMLQWSEYSRWFFHNPIFAAGLVSWGIRFWALWYATTVKDRWDNTLPILPKRLSVFFLAQTPMSVGDVLARISLVWSIYFGIVGPLVLGGPVERFLKANPSFTSMLNALPVTPTWERVLFWVVSILSPALAYLWAKVEFEASGSKSWLPFPHNLRFFYPASGWQEVLSRCVIILLFIQVIIQLFSIPKTLSIVYRLIPTEYEDSIAIGVLSILLMEFISVALILYGSYRLGLLSYLKSQDIKLPPPPIASI